MITLKFKSNFTKEDIDLLFKASAIHASFEDEFGTFCAGIATALRSVFEYFQKIKRGTWMDLNTQQVTVNTVLLLDALDDAKRDLVTSEADKISNKQSSDMIMEFAEQIRIEREKIMAKKEK